MSHKENLVGARTGGVFFGLPGCCLDVFLSICLALLPVTAVAGFYPTRNQNPFTLFQGQPLPLPANAASMRWSYQLSLDISNSLNAQSSASQALLVDFEAYNLNARFAGAVNERLAVIIDVPVLRRGGGFLDAAIDSWHDTFGLPRASRPLVADDRYLINYQVDGNDQITLDEAETTVADIAIHAGYSLLRSEDSSVSLWAGVELPSGDQASLSGNDATDFHLTLAVNNRSVEGVELDANLGVVFPGDDLFAANMTEDSVLFAYAAGSWQLLDWLQLKLQLEAHQSYFSEDRLDLLDKANVIVFGGAWTLSRCERLDIGVSEDIDVGSSPDVSFLIAWTHSC